MKKMHIKVLSVLPTPRAALRILQLSELQGPVPALSTLTALSGPEQKDGIQRGARVVRAVSV